MRVPPHVGVLRVPILRLYVGVYVYVRCPVCECARVWMCICKCMWTLSLLEIGVGDFHCASVQLAKSSPMSTCLYGCG